MTSVLRDLRYAVRVLRHSSGFTAAAMLTMAVDLGAAVAIFVVDPQWTRCADGRARPGVRHLQR